MKKKTTQTKMEKRFFLLIAILALIAIGVVAYGVGSTLTGGNHVKNADSGTEEETSLQIQKLLCGKDNETA